MLSQLQDALRAIENGQRLEKIDAVLIRQALDESAPSPVGSGAAPPRQRSPSRWSLQRQPEDPVAPLVAALEPSDAYRALVDLRRRRQRQLKTITPPSSSPRKLTKPSQPKVTTTTTTTHHYAREPLEHDDGRRSTNQQPVDDGVLSLEKALRASAMSNAVLLERATADADAQAKALTVMLEKGRGLLPLEFLFERNLKEYCAERSLNVLHGVLARFQHRLFTVYLAHWRTQTAILRRLAQERAKAEIVRVYRGFQARKLCRAMRKQWQELAKQATQLRTFRIRYRHAQASKLQMCWRRFRYRQATFARIRRAQAAVFLQRRYRDARLKKNQLVNAVLNFRRHMAAIRIQRVFRGHRARLIVHMLRKDEKQQRLVAEILARNTSTAALIAWKLEQQGAAFIIARFLFPYLLRCRFMRWIRDLRRKSASRTIQRYMKRWFHIEDNRAKKRLEWLELARVEQRKLHKAALRVQTCWRRSFHERKYLVTVTRIKKLERKRRIALKEEQMLQFRKHVTSSLKTQKLLGAIKAAGRPTATRADPQHRKDAANHIQQAYKRHVRAVRDRRLAWQARALRVEERVRRRHHAAKMIQKRVRGMIGRKIARIKRAEQMMRRCIQQLKWKRIRRRIIAGRRIGNWVVRKRAQRLASLWKLEKKRQLEMTVRLQRWVRNHIISRRRLYLLLAEGRRQEETLLFCEQSVRICAQHVADELVMESRGRGFEEALKKHWAITSGTAKTKRTRAPAFPALQMMYLVVSGVRDISKWKEMDEKALVSTRMERLKAVALFKSASKHHQITKQAVTAKTADGDSGNALSPSKVKTKELFSATDVDISMAKAAGSSKRPLSYEEFTHVLRLIAEMKLGDKVQIWWGKYDGGDAQFLALLWKYLFVISDLRPVAQQLMQYANDLLHKRCRTIQRLATKHKQFLTGAFIRLQKRKERELLIKERMAIKIQTRMRSYLAVNKRKRRVQEVYNKFIDAEWGLPYWMNPITGYSTWEKPTILGNQDVNKEPVPCPPADLRLTVQCNGKKECPEVPDWYCYKCSEFFCNECRPQYHQDPALKAGRRRSSIGKLTKAAMEKALNTGKAEDIAVAPLATATPSTSSKLLVTESTRKRLGEDAQQAQVEELIPHLLEGIKLCGLCNTQVATHHCLDCSMANTRKMPAKLSRSSSTDAIDLKAKLSKPKESEGLFCDTCFSFLHRRGNMVTHKFSPLTKFCKSCNQDPNERTAQHTVQYECTMCEHKPKICGRCAVTKHPVESCGELTKLEFESLAMHNYREQERKEQEERDKHDIVKIKERMLQAKKERCAIKLQKFWHQQSPLMRARRMIKEKRKETDAYYQQYLLDRKKERELRFRAKQFIGKAPILPTDSPVTQCLRRMTVLQRRRLEIRARMFGLLVSEYMLEGVPLPGVGRLRNGGRYIESSEDLRGWVMNRQTLRLRKLEKRRADDDSPKPKDIILDIDRKLKVEERRIPLEQVYNRALSQPEGANVADDAAAEDGVDIFQLFLVEFSMELRRPIWFSHPFAQRYHDWRKRRAEAQKEKREAMLAKKASQDRKGQGANPQTADGNVDATKGSNTDANPPATPPAPAPMKAHPRIPQPPKEPPPPAYAYNAYNYAAADDNYYDANATTDYNNYGYDYGSTTAGYDYGDYYSQTSYDADTSSMPAYSFADASGLVSSANYFYGTNDQASWAGYNSTGTDGSYNAISQIYGAAEYATDNSGGGEYAYTSNYDAYGYQVAAADAPVDTAYTQGDVGYGSTATDWTSFGSQSSGAATADAAFDSAYPAADYYDQGYASQEAYGQDGTYNYDYGYEGASVTATYDYYYSNDTANSGAYDHSQSYAADYDSQPAVYDDTNMPVPSFHDDAAVGIADLGSTDYTMDFSGSLGAASADDWEEVYDPNSNQVYYYNRQTQETAWERPTW